MHERSIHMRAILFTFLVLVAGVAKAEKIVPSGVECMKLARDLGFSVVDTYQTCTVRPVTRTCILEQQKENKGLARDKKELAQLGKLAIKECQK
jgi:hypothetical protein